MALIGRHEITEGRTAQWPMELAMALRERLSRVEREGAPTFRVMACGPAGRQSEPGRNGADRGPLSLVRSLGFVSPEGVVVTFRRESFTPSSGWLASA